MFLNQLACTFSLLAFDRHISDGVSVKKKKELIGRNRLTKW